MDWKLCTVAMASLSLLSCAKFSINNKKPAKALSGLDAYQQAGGRISNMGTATASVSLSGQSEATGITRDKDIIWAPENPDEAIGSDLENIWKQPESKSWHTSNTEASRQSRQSGKPMLIWFTDSNKSPLCRKLSDELFSTSEFEKWAAETLVRLRVDSTLPAKEKNTELGFRKSKHIEKLKKRYGVHGYPTVLILTPRGAVEASYRGYKKGTFDYYWGQMKQAVINAEEDYGAWREKLESRGYRLWTNREGRKTLAKLQRFQSGRISLVDPDGKRSATSIRNLSDADQTWLLQQKKQYDAQKQR